MAESLVRRRDGQAAWTRWIAVQDAIDAANAWDLDRQLEIAMDAMRLPPGDAQPHTLSGGERRRVALCKVLLQKPDLLLLDEPTNHLDAESVAWLERHLQEYHGTVVAVTHDRYFLDNVAQWILELDRGQRHSLEGQLLVVAGAEAGPAGEGREAGIGPPQGAGPRAGMGEDGPARSRRQEQGPLERLREVGRPGIRGTRGRTGHANPAGTAPRRRGGAGRERPQGLRRQSADGGPEFRSAARRHRRHHRPQRRRQDDAVPHDRRPGEAGRRHAARRRYGGAGLRRSEPRHARRQQDRLRGDHRRRRSPDARQAPASPRAATSSRFNFKGPDQQRKVGELSGGERNRVHLAKLLRRGGNLLLLDEPTNDLDVERCGRWKRRC